MPSDKEIIEAFKEFNNVWRINRSGLIISLSGARVGNWLWQNNNLLVKPENDIFKKDFRRLVKEGIIVREPTEDFTGGEDSVTKSGDPSTLKIVQIAQASPGQLDSALKIMGYFMLETNLGLNTRGEE